MAPRSRIAVIRGPYLRPGVSKNNRRYTTEHVRDSVQRGTAQIGSAEGLPITMLPSHAAARNDDVLSTVGRVTKLWQESDGSGWYEAEVPDTQAGHDLVALTTPDADGKRYLSGVSLRGNWVGDVTTETGPDGSPIETAPGLELKGIDFTHRPGVTGAGVADVALESVLAGCGILEAAPAGAEFVDEAGKEPYGDVAYADPGYQSDGKKRYPIDTAAHVRAAWSYVNQGKNAAKYSAKQLARVKGRIKAAAKRLGVNITQEQAILTAQLAEALEEAYACMSVDNGQGSVSVSGYTNEPAELQKVASRIALAAMAGLTALDPDDDGDVDIGTSGESADDECTGCGAELPEGAAYCPACGQVVPQAESAAPTQEEADMANANAGAATVPAPPKPLHEMSDDELRAYAAECAKASGTTTETAPAPASGTADTSVTETTSPAPAAAPRNLTDADVAALAAALKPAEAAPAATETAATETAPAPAPATGLTEALAEMERRVREEVRRDVIAAYGLPTRKGLVVAEMARDAASGTDTPAKPLHEMSMEELRDHTAKIAGAVYPD